MTHQNKQTTNHASLIPWPWLCGFLMLVVMHFTWAAQSLYENDGVVDITIPTDLFQPPDATNFVNTGLFEISFSEIENSETIESEDTINYTNTGTMVADCLFDDVDDNLNLTPGCGFNFDYYNTQSGLESMAGSFYNAGSIRANSVTDLGFFSQDVNTVGKNTVNATNIINPGTLDVGVDGLMSLSGQYIDLTRGTLNLEISATNNVTGTGAFGLDTNGDWNPGTDLTATTAESSDPFVIELIGTTPFFNFSSPNNGTNEIIRSAFVEDFSAPSVPFKVYFDSTANFGGGSVTVEWTGSYMNYATGTGVTNYLYLNDNYLQGAATNVGLVGLPGYPANFTFTESSTETIPGTQAAAGFFNVFPNGAISNRYSYALAQLISADTNAGPVNPSGALTNIPSRLQINASKDLNLTFANINQPGYMSLTATNQFDGSVGATIGASFSDINFGVTNGFLTISNLLLPEIPVWSGNVDAWSTRFVNTNSLSGTNDYRVLIAASFGLLPFAQTYVQNLKLHGTNLVLSDELNVLTKISIDAQNFTLTTNPIATGANSPAGELVWINKNILFSNSLPNLVNLTNNGVISANNLISLGQYLPLNSIINNGTILDNGTAFWVTNFQCSGTVNAGINSFQVNASTVNLTNGSIYAVSNNILIVATTIDASNVVLDAGNALTLAATGTNWDGVVNGTTGLTNGNNWSVGPNAASGFHGIYLQNGFNLTNKPAFGNLLGTTVTSVAPPNKLINNLWAAQDYGAVNTGFTNNMALGQLILIAQTNGPASQFYFSGTGVSNAMYVDHLVLDGYASYLYHSSTNSIPALAFNTNLVIYYADATAAGVGDVSFLLNGFNGNHLQWVPTYTGYFSSTNIVYPNGSTNALNSGLVNSPFLDSNANGTPNSSDPTPLFVPSQMNFMSYMTNNPANTMVISWDTIPLATNFVYYSTNMVNWQLLTNAYLMTNPFVTPEPAPGTITNLMVLDPIAPPMRCYRVVVYPDILNP